MEDGKEAFVARIDEIASKNPGVLQIRVGLFADRVIREMLAELTSLAEKTMKGRF